MSFHFVAAINIHSDFGAQENKVCHCFHCFPIIYHEVMGPDAMTLVFCMLSFRPAFSLSSFTFIKRLFSFSSLSAIGGEHGSPLQYSCLENPMDRGAWWVTVHRVTKSRTQLKRLSMNACTHFLPLKWCHLHI